MAFLKWFLFDVIRVPRKNYGIVVGTMLTICALFLLGLLGLGFQLLGRWLFDILIVLVVATALLYFLTPSVWLQIARQFTATKYFLETRHFATLTRSLTKAQFGIFLQACEAMCARANNQIAVRYIENWNKSEMEEGHESSILSGEPASGELMSIKIRPDTIHNIAPAGLSPKINLFKIWKSHKKIERSMTEKDQAEICNESMYLECCVDLIETVNDIFNAHGVVKEKYHSEHDVKALLFARYRKLNDKFEGTINIKPEQKKEVPKTSRVPDAVIVNEHSAKMIPPTGVALPMFTAADGKGIPKTAAAVLEGYQEWIEEADEPANVVIKNEEPIAVRDDKIIELLEKQNTLIEKVSQPKEISVPIVEAIKELTEQTKQPAPVYTVKQPKEATFEQPGKKRKKVTDEQYQKAVKYVIDEGVSLGDAEKKFELWQGALSTGKGGKLLAEAEAAVSRLKKRTVSNDVGNDFRFNEAR